MTGFNYIDPNTEMAGHTSDFAHWGVVSNVFSKPGCVTLYDSAMRLHYRAERKKVWYEILL